MTTLIGFGGALIVLIAFVLNQIHKLNEDDTTYDVLNLVGSAMLVAYALIIRSYPFAILNLVWAGVSLSDVVSDVRRGPQNKKPPEQRSFR